MNNNQDMLSSLWSAYPFFYKIEEEYFVVNGNKTMKYDSTRIISHNKIDLYKTYEELVELYKNESYYNEDKYARFIYDLIDLSDKDTFNKNNDSIITTETFWNELSEKNKEGLYRQVETFKSLVTVLEINKRYPHLRDWIVNK